MKALTKTDRIFLAVLAGACLLHLFFLFGPPLMDDETFYLSFPFRLVQGDSLVRDEWHLAQFSSLFSYLPVRIWYSLRGSADGLVIFMRCLYLSIHTVAAILIYQVFRKAEKPAIAASMVFYLQTPYRIYSISYHSMFVLFLLFLSLSLLCNYRNPAKKYCLAAGVSFGACCVNNPLFVLLLPLYLLLFLLWTKRDLIAILASKKHTKSRRTRQPKTNRKKAVPQQKESSLFSFLESCSCFFNRQALLYMCLGTGVIATVSVAFFFGTGGTIHLLIQNLKYLFTTSEYHLASFSIYEKCKQFWEAVYYSSFKMPFLLPLLFLALLIDKKRKCNSHRVIYLSVALLLSILHFIGGLIVANLASLPFALVSFVCYLLTEKKNRVLFACIYFPFAVAVVVGFFASNVPLASLGTILPVCSVAGVFFARDLLQELRQQQTDESGEQKSESRLFFANRAVICAALVSQILIYTVALMLGQMPAKNAVRITEGPLSGILLPDSQYQTYESFLRDLDNVKSRSTENDPLLIVGYQNWLYLYAERPIAAHTVWFRGLVVKDDLLLYYKVNPQKTPKYIYVADDNVTSAEANIKLLQDLFTFSEERLSGGVLLTVADCRFER